MSIYVTLPCNASIDNFPLNIHNSYTVKLESPLNLDGDYDVGLCEIVYPKTWSVKLGSISIIRSDGSKLTSVEIEEFDKTLITTLSKSISNKIMHADSSIKNSNIIYYDEAKSCYGILVLPHYQVKLNPLFANIFGFSEYHFIKTSYGKKMDKYESINLVPALYVYCDIIEHQFVGDKKTQLLRNISTHTPESSHRYLTFDTPHYIAVKQKVISTITINIRSDLGELIPFIHGKSLVKLHFKPR